MKGNPMQRNFGIGTPAKQFEEGDYYDTRSKSPSKQFEEGDYYDTRSKSPNKQTYDANGTDERVYDVNQEKYDKWRKGKGAPDVRYLGSKENKKHLDAYLDFKKSGGKVKEAKSTSPNKQRDLGGTKSGKGNVFTKRGRTQKKINAERAETAKLKKEHIAENKRSTYLATKDHEAKMIKKQLKNRPKTVVMKGDKDVTDQYR